MSSPVRISAGVIALVVSVALVACAADEDFRTACGGPTKPLTEEEVLAALRSQDFTAFAEEKSEFCGMGAEAVLANVVETGPHRNVSDFKEVIERRDTLVVEVP